MQKLDIIMVTGAPGSGKTTVIEHLLRLNLSNTAIFDIDSIMGEVSELAGKEIYLTKETWVPFRKIWISILNSVVESGITPIFFSASDKEDFESLSNGLSLRWIALDCDDATRLSRLVNRNYTQEQINDILQDAQKIRENFDILIDTTDLRPETLATELLSVINEEK